MKISDYLKQSDFHRNGCGSIGLLLSQDTEDGVWGRAVGWFIILKKETKVVAVVEIDKERKLISEYIRQNFFFLYNCHFPKARQNLVKNDGSLYTVEHSVFCNSGCWCASHGIFLHPLLPHSPSSKPKSISCLAPHFAGRWIFTTRLLPVEPFSPGMSLQCVLLMRLSRTIHLFRGIDPI